MANSFLQDIEENLDKIGQIIWRHDASSEDMDCIQEKLSLL